MRRSRLLASLFLGAHGRVLRILSAVILLLTVTACLPEPPTPTPAPPTETPTITPTATSTIVWFPPTPTFTPAPTRQIEPTVDLRTSVGEVWFKDNFTDPDDWLITRTTAGSVAYGKEELTLAVSAEKGILYSLRKTPQLDDFYLEIDALPSLCRPKDIYGLLLRATSSADHYRLMMTCGGELRLERLTNSRYTVLHDWSPSGQFPVGGMVRVRLGVWAQGEELRFFVNDAYQFTIRDTALPSGVVGVYARSAGDTPLTVSFSNLVVYHLDEAAALPSATPIPTPTPK